MVNLAYLIAKFVWIKKYANHAQVTVKLIIVHVQQVSTRLVIKKFALNVHGLVYHVYLKHNVLIVEEIDQEHNVYVTKVIGKIKLLNYAKNVYTDVIHAQTVINVQLVAEQIVLI